MTTPEVQMGPLTSIMSVAGWVVDDATGRPLAGATVEIGSGLQQTTTAADGSFRFLGLPVGDYQLSATLPGAGRRYGNDTGAATVRAGSRPLVTLRLPPTGVSGTVMSPVGGAVYPLVRLVGSSEEVYGEADGSFRLLGVEPGPRELLITAPGCALCKVSAALTQGTIEDAGEIQLTEVDRTF